MTMFKDVFNMAINDPNHNYDTGSFKNKGNVVKELAGGIFEVLRKHPNLELEKCNALITTIYNIVKDVDFSQGSSREEMLKKILHSMQDDTKITSWENILNLIDPLPDKGIFKCLYYYSCMKLTTLVLKFNQERTKREVPLPDTKLTDKEQTVLY